LEKYKILFLNSILSVHYFYHLSSQKNAKHLEALLLLPASGAGRRKGFSASQVASEPAEHGKAEGCTLAAWPALYPSEPPD